VAEWLIGLKIDVILLTEDLQGKGPAYVFSDAGVETQATRVHTLNEALAEQLSLQQVKSQEEQTG
jgi:hypothetical protein